MPAVNWEFPAQFGAWSKIGYVFAAVTQTGGTVVLHGTDG
jgi:hypothetical protein